MTKRGFRNPIPENPIYSEYLFRINDGSVSASDERFLNIMDKDRVNIAKQLNYLEKEFYLNKEKSGKGNQTMYSVNWDKIVDLFVIYNEKKLKVTFSNKKAFRVIYKEFPQANKILNAGFSLTLNSFFRFIVFKNLK